MSLSSRGGRAFQKVVLHRRSRLIYFFLNLILMVPLFVRNYSPIGLAAGGAMLLAGMYFFVIKPGNMISAVRELPVLVFFDGLAFLGLKWQAVGMAFDLQNFRSIIDRPGVAFPVLVVAGLALNWFIKRKTGLYWLRALGKALVGLGVICLLWSDGSLPLPKFFEQGRVCVEIYALAALGWICLCLLSLQDDEGAYKRNNNLSNLLLVLFFLWCTLDYMFAYSTFIQLAAVQLGAITVPWWKVLVVSGGLLAAAAACYDYDRYRIGTDALLLAGLASVAFLLKLLQTHYFLCNWAILAAVMLGTVRCMKNEANLDKTLRLSSIGYMAAQLGVAVLLVLMLSRGIWMTALVMAAYGMIYFSGHRGRRSSEQRTFFWMLAVSAAPMVALSYVWHTRWSASAVMVLLITAVMGMFAMYIVSKPHPAYKQAKNSYKAVLICAVALISLVVAFRGGAKVDIQADYINGMVLVETEPVGKKNELVSVQYTWSDVMQKGYEGSQGEISSQGGELVLESRTLTIRTIDAQGVQTVVTKNFPAEMLMNQP